MPHRKSSPRACLFPQIIRPRNPHSLSDFLATAIVVLLSIYLATTISCKAMEQQSPEATRRTALGGDIGMMAIWDEAINSFKNICGESLLRGDVKSFDDVQKKIERVSKVASGLDPEEEEKWDKAKRVGLDSLKYLKMLVGVASKASSLVCRSARYLQPDGS